MCVFVYILSPDVRLSHKTEKNQQKDTLQIKKTNTNLELGWQSGSGVSLLCLSYEITGDKFYTFPGHKFWLPDMTGKRSSFIALATSIPTMPPIGLDLSNQSFSLRAYGLSQKRAIKPQELRKVIVRPEGMIGLSG